MVCTVGASNQDYVESVIETSNGSLVVTGYTNSYGAGLYDLWLLKFSSDGTLLWTQTLGGSDDDYGESVIETSDGGLVVTGPTRSLPSYTTFPQQIHIVIKSLIVYNNKKPLLLSSAQNAYNLVSSIINHRLVA